MQSLQKEKYIKITFHEAMQCVVQFVILKAGFTNDRVEVGAIIRNAEYIQQVQIQQVQVQIQQEQSSGSVFHYIDYNLSYSINNKQKQKNLTNHSGWDWE